MSDFAAASAIGECAVRRPRFHRGWASLFALDHLVGPRPNQRVEHLDGVEPHDSRVELGHARAMRAAWWPPITVLPYDAKQPALLMVGGVIDIELVTFLAHPAERHRGQILVRMVDAGQQQHQRPAQRDGASCSAPARTPASARIAAIVPVVICPSRVDVRWSPVKCYSAERLRHQSSALGQAGIGITPSALDFSMPLSPTLVHSPVSRVEPLRL